MENFLKESVARYLQYLKEISRKIVVREGFEAVLGGTGRKKQDAVRQAWELETRVSASHPQRQWWEAVGLALDRQADRRLFLGLGLVAGRFNGRRIAAPVVFVELEVQRDEATQTLELLYDWETLSLNYDLLSTLTGALQEEEDLLDAALLEREMVFVETFERDMERLFPGCQPDVEAQASFARSRWGVEPEGTTEAALLYDFLIHWASYLVGRMRELFPACVEVKPWPGGYRYEDERAATGARSNKPPASIFDLPASSVAAAHVFLAAVPPQLTAFAALRELIREVEARGFRNQMLTRLLGSALLGLPLPIEVESEGAPVSLPMSLTEAQQAALRMARTSEISYVQGPPGSGKSHTIVGLMLDALARGERVLLVSQKEAALTVVAERMARLFDGVPSPLCTYVRADRTRLREDLKGRVSLGQRSERPVERLAKLKQQLESIELEIEAEEERFQTLSERLTAYNREQRDFQAMAAGVGERYEALSRNYPGCAIPPRRGGRNGWHQRYHRLERLSQEAARQPRPRIVQWYIDRVRKELANPWAAPTSAFDQDGFAFALDWLKLHEARETAFTRQPDALRVDPGLAGDVEAVGLGLNQLRLRRLAVKYQIKLTEGAAETEGRDALHRFEKMLHWRRPALIIEKMEALDYGRVLDLLPLWAAETRFLGELFPLEPDLFDLVVVDEASQVNLAEILPALYRGRRVCIVGDHCQLSIESTGLNFALRRKFDALTWGRFRPASLNYDQGRQQQLTVTEGSILDLIRNPAHGAWIPQVMLDEHLRSHPALARFTAKFYESESRPLRVMTDRADRYFQPAAEVAWVGGVRAEDRTQPAEMEQVVDWLRALAAGRHAFCRFLGVGFSVGVLSPIRSQCTALQERIDGAFSEKEIEKLQVMVGTPEEFQGNERDVMIISLCLDGESRLGVAHYQNARRVNVATSRARQAVLLTAGVRPDGLRYWAEYARLLENDAARDAPPWPSSTPSPATDWEAALWPVFEALAADSGARLWGRAETCGLMAPFVFTRKDGSASCCVELDGLHGPDTARERSRRLQRAGWQVIHTPLSRWRTGPDWLATDAALASPEYRRLQLLVAHRLGL